MARGKIGLWMYRNVNGSTIQEKLKNILEKAGAIVINDFDMRECYCFSGRVYTKNGYDLSNLDVLYHMNADEQTDFQMDILKAIELTGVKIVNDYSSFSKAGDKFITNLLLRKHNINVPPSILINNKPDKSLLKKIFNEWKTILIKPRNAFGGKGIIKFSCYDQFIDFLTSTQNFLKSYYIEKFLPFKDNDYRVEIFNNKYIGSYSRALIHEYKTNISIIEDKSQAVFLGLQPELEQINLAMKAARILNITTTIVDMVQSIDDNKLYVLEVNPIMGIFVQATNTIQCITVKGDYNYASDEKKLVTLAHYLLSLLDNKSNNKVGI